MKSRYFSKKVLFVLFSFFFVSSLFSFNTGRFNDLLDEWIKTKGYKQGITSRDNIKVKNAIKYGRLKRKKEEDVVKEIENVLNGTSEKDFIIYDENFFKNIKDVERKKKKKPPVPKKKPFGKKKFFRLLDEWIKTKGYKQGITSRENIDVNEAIKYGLSKRKKEEDVVKEISSKERFVIYDDNYFENVKEIELKKKKKPPVPKKKPFGKKKFKSTNLGKQILNVAKGKKVLKVKFGGRELPIYIEKLKDFKDVTVIQLPCLSQRDWDTKGWHGRVCALHAVGNSEILASDKMNYIQVVKALNLIKTKNRILRLIKNNYKGKLLAGMDIRKVKELEDCGGEVTNLITPNSKIKRNIVDRVNVFGPYFEHVVDEMDDPRYRFMKKNIVEVLILNTGGHWIAARLEKLSDSKYAIIFADSIAAKSGKYDNDVDCYQEYFGQLAAQFGVK